MQPRTTALLVGSGGALGSTLRWAVSEAVEPTTAFPVATFVVNLAGCLLLGLVFDRANDSVRAAIGVGFCGGLTTFSTIAVEVVGLAEHDDATMAVVYLTASVVAGLALLIGGRRVSGTRT